MAKVKRKQRAAAERIAELEASLTDANVRVAELEAELTEARKLSRPARGDGSKR
jgi:predicted RNase H-like nuclease (RuvC/YqgF family)